MNIEKFKYMCLLLEKYKKKCMPNSRICVIYLKLSVKLVWSVPCGDAIRHLLIKTKFFEKDFEATYIFYQVQSNMDLGY